MTAWIEHHHRGLTPEALSERIFSGRILLFEGLQPMRDLIAAARRLIEPGFAPLDPPTAHGSLDRDDYHARCDAARRAFGDDAGVRLAFEAALSAAGADRRTTFRDRLVLRVSPPGAEGYERAFGVIPPHRDSWGSGLACQINWWLPVYPVSQQRTLALFPAHWAKPIANDCAGWDRRRAGKAPDVPLLPTAQAAPDRAGEIRLTVEPGTLVAFSAAHLHASVPNATSLARFSAETRTVALDDLRAGRGAPDIDGAAVAPALGWFRRLGGGERLSQALGAS